MCVQTTKQEVEEKKKIRIVIKSKTSPGCGHIEGGSNSGKRKEAFSENETEFKCINQTESWVERKYDGGNCGDTPKRTLIPTLAEGARRPESDTSSWNLKILSMGII